MKKIDAKKYFLFVIPTLVIYRVIAFFTIDYFVTNEFYSRFINMVLVIAICLIGLKFGQKKEKNS
ncbi:MAG: hypothetical protein ACI4HI_16925 [Lachnospiraceae bacterium]